MRCVYLSCLLFLCGWNSASAGETQAFTRLFEEAQLERLAGVQAGAELADFSSDGCSGGLSAGWRVLSEHLPVFRRKFGEHPPYEHCCVAHDRLYWRGETERGYEKRLAADEALRQCVIDTGQQIKSEVAAEFSLSELAITRNFLVIADLMFDAVRAGGMPCYLFSWRWGYGWPQCPLL